MQRLTKQSYEAERYGTHYDAMQASCNWLLSVRADDHTYKILDDLTVAAYKIQDSGYEFLGFLRRGYNPVPEQRPA